MKKIVIITVGLFLVGCGSAPPKTREIDVVETPDVYAEESVSPVLLTKIDEFIDHVDTVSGYEEWPVIKILFAESKRVNCKNCVWITNSLFYGSEYMLGFFRYRNKTIGVINYRGNYFDDFIDTVKLTKGIPEGVSDTVRGFSEPLTRNYKILNTDSLQLIYDGYL